MGSKNPFRTRNAPPPFRKGDFVTPCIGKRSYCNWRHGQFREILDVIYDESQGLPGTWVLVIWNPVKSHFLNFEHQCSKYNPANFTKESYIMPAPPSFHDHANCRCIPPQLVAAEKAQWMGVRVSSPDDYASSEPPIKWEVVISPRDSISEVERLAEADMNAGEVILIVKTVKKLEGLPPRPPIRITEFR